MIRPKVKNQDAAAKSKWEMTVTLAWDGEEGQIKMVGHMYTMESTDIDSCQCMAKTTTIL